MKLNRRKLFAAGAGAAVAAQGIGGGSMAKAATPSRFYDGAVKDYPQADPEWTARQLARAKRIAAGEFLPEDESYPTEGLACPFEPLRSVSQSAKRLMRDRRNRQWHRSRMMENARKALDEFDKFGVIRSLF